jgi:Tfp pilus assembly protein FimV
MLAVATDRPVRPISSRHVPGEAVTWATGRCVPPSSPNYALRRAVVGAVFAVVALVLAFAALAAVEALADLGGRPAAASETGPAPISRIHVVEPGDTLWSIAAAHRGEIGHVAYVDAMIGLNGGTDIQLGQAVRLP